jgi:L-threonylcarbamoyladenylate synthase
MTGVTTVIGASDEAVERAVALLARDAPVALPTETVYGLAARASSSRAIAEVFRIKARPSFDPLIVHVARAERPIEALLDRKVIGPIGRSADLAALLVERFWPGPLTLVLPRGARVDPLATSGLDRVAVRSPANAWFLRVLERLGEPLVAPSANRFGRISPTRAEHVVAELDGLVPLVIDGGPCAVGIESTVVSIEPDGGLVLLRPGGTAARAIEEVAGVALAEPRSSERPEAPGMLASHYAPERRLFLAGEVGSAARDRRIGLLTALPWDRAAIAALERELGGTVAVARALSTAGDDAEAARNLFGELRALDRAGVDVLVAERWPDDHGLGRAINDRLRRAAQRG